MSFCQKRQWSWALTNIVRQKNEERRLVEERRREERETRISENPFENFESTALDSFEAEEEISTVDAIFKGSERNIKYVDTTGGDREVNNNKNNFSRLVVSLRAPFLVGDKLIFYPDRDCKISPRRQIWTEEIEKEVSSLIYKNALDLSASNSPLLPGAVDLNISFNILKSEIDEGIFHPTMRYVRDGEISKCYPFIERSMNLIKDSTQPLKPEVIRVINQIDSNGVAKIEVHGNLEPGYLINFYRTSDCTGNVIGQKGVGLSSIGRLNYVIPSSDLPSNPGSEVIFNFSARYVDLADNESECSSSVSQKQIFNADLQSLIVTPTNINFKVYSSMASNIDYIGNSTSVNIAAPTLFSGDKILFYLGENCNASSQGGALEATAANQALNKNITCSPNAESTCSISAKKISVDGSESCHTIKYFVDSKAPEVEFKNLARVQYLVSSNPTGNPQSVVFSTIEKGLALSVDDDVKNHFGGQILNLLKVKKYSDSACGNNASDITIEAGSTYENFFIFPEAISSVNAFQYGAFYFKLEDIFGNESPCMRVNKLIFEPLDIGVKLKHALGGNISADVTKSVLVQYAYAQDNIVGLNKAIDPASFFPVRDRAYIFGRAAERNNYGLTNEIILFNLDKVSETSSNWKARYYATTGCSELPLSNLISVTKYTHLSIGDLGVLSDLDPFKTIGIGEVQPISQESITQIYQDVNNGLRSLKIINSFGVEECINFQALKEPHIGFDPPYELTSISSNLDTLTLNITSTDSAAECANLNLSGPIESGRAIMIPVPSACSNFNAEISNLNPNLEGIYEMVAYFPSRSIWDPNHGGSLAKLDEASLEGACNILSENYLTIFPNFDYHSSSDGYILGNHDSGFLNAMITSILFGDDYQSYTLAPSRLSIPLITDASEQYGAYLLCVENISKYKPTKVSPIRIILESN